MKEMSFKSGKKQRGRGKKRRQSDRQDGHSRAGSGQATESTCGLPHQVNGPAIGRQGKQHVVTHLFVSLHLLLKETRDSLKALFS